jgi:hypothetical protein
MNEFLEAIPAAAQSSYALFAYCIAAVIFIVAGSKLRSLRIVMKSIALVPPDDRRHVIESVSDSVIPKSISAEEWIRNNRNRWLFLLALCSLLLLSVIGIVAYMSPKSIAGPGPSPSNADAETAIRSWLRLEDALDFAGSYRELYPATRASASVDTWIDLSRRYRTPLGRVESRTLASESATKTTLDVPVNAKEYMYATKFESSAIPIREFISIASPGVPIPWRVVGYHIDVPP